MSKEASGEQPMRLGKLCRVVEGSIHAVTHVFRRLSYVGIAAMLLLVCADVFGRTFLDQSVKGTVELVELLNATLVFFALAYVTLQKRHVEITLVVSRWSQRAQARLSIFTSLVTAAMMALIAWQLGLRSWETFVATYKWQTGTLGIWFSPFVFIASLGCAVMVLESLVILAHSIAEVMRE